MRFFLNDLSLDGQYPGADEFIADLRGFLDARARTPALRADFHCSTSVPTLRVTATASLRQAVESKRDRDLSSRVFGWLSKAGPFWEADRNRVIEDPFHFADHEVTEQGLGESARRKLTADDVTSVGFPKSPHGCDDPVLDVLRGPRGSPVATVSITNVIGAAALEEAARGARPEPACWEDVAQRAREDFDGLMLAPDVVDSLRPHPFSKPTARHILDVLKVVHDFVRSRDASGLSTDETNRMTTEYFAGRNAWFSDESTTNKSRYRTEMTFADPMSPREKIFCPFHGKVVGILPIRIHLAWPILCAERVARIVYIGPKLTR